MAIPSGYFDTRLGIALMRQNVSTGEWFFVDWVRDDADFALDTPGTGTWKYAHWAIAGASYPSLTGFEVGLGVATRGAMVVTNLKR